jgi:hypothetical protein
METKSKKYFHWLLVPAFITIYKWLSKKNSYDSIEEKEAWQDKGFDAITWILIYAALAFIVIREITYQVPVIIMT